MRYSVAVDFDGVIHSYTTPWVNAHTIPDPPVEGSIGWLVKLTASFQVMIFSTRCATSDGVEAMCEWLATWIGKELDLPYKEAAELTDIFEFTYTKKPALVYVDDRAYRFEGPGTFPSAEDIHRMRPWNKEKKS